MSGKKAEEDRHFKATSELLAAAAAFKEVTEHSGRHQESQTVLEGFAASVAELRSAARALELVYADELEKTPAESLGVRELTQATILSMHNAGTQLAEAASTLENSLHSGDGLIGHKF